jgi:DMSO/TMAO reductase YedYZ molybdopterin-dependent catalytic subunit
MNWKNKKLLQRATINAPKHAPISRRSFLGSVAVASLGAAIDPTVSLSTTVSSGVLPTVLAQGAPTPSGAAQTQGAQPPDYPGKDKGLVILGERLRVAETPEHLLDDETTPISKFFIRNNGQVPESALNSDAWKLVIDGEVNNRLELTLAELRFRVQPKTYRMMLECGSNGRFSFQPQARDNQWTNGGAGCTDWTGIPLREVLQAAGLKDTANYGTDLHLSGDTTKDSLSRGIPIAKMMVSPGRLP